MRFNCGKHYDARQADKEVWHRWFAWYPVHIEENCRWLEIIDRKGRRTFWGCDECWFWRYRSIK